MTAAAAGRDECANQKCRPCRNLYLYSNTVVHNNNCIVGECIEKTIASVAIRFVMSPFCVKCRTAGTVRSVHCYCFYSFHFHVLLSPKSSRNVQREPSGDRLRLHVGRHVHGMDALLIGSDHSTKRLANVPYSTSSTSAIHHRLLDTAAARTLPPD